MKSNFYNKSVQTIVLIACVLSVVFLVIAAYIMYNRTVSDFETSIDNLVKRHTIVVKTMYEKTQSMQAVIDFYKS